MHSIEGFWERDAKFPVRLHESSRSCSNSSLVTWVSFEVGVRYSLDDEASFLWGMVG